ncbi:MAG: hypothetical protein U5L96_01745 [Owenweeksia sp.]|nr:hypothetical protein [Owenweeksia sp.]
MAISISEEKVLINNTDFDIWEGMSVTQLREGVRFCKASPAGD